MKATITRRSKNIGFGYTAGVEQGEHGLYVPAPTAPCITGTVRTILRDIEDDRNYRSFQGGTCYSSSWFVKIAGEWYRIKRDQYYHPADLLALNADEDGYLYKSIEIEIEKIN